jgi:hypothetical protein
LVLGQANASALPLKFDQADVLLNGSPAPLASCSICGLRVIAPAAGPQIAVTEQLPTAMISLRRGEQVEIVVPVHGLEKSAKLTAKAALTEGRQAEVSLSWNQAGDAWRGAGDGESLLLESTAVEDASDGRLYVKVRSVAGDATIRLREVRVIVAGQAFDVPLLPSAHDVEKCPAPVLPLLRPAIERMLVEWDWRMQDGIETARLPSSYEAAIGRTLDRGDALIADLQVSGLPLSGEAAQWNRLRTEWKDLAAAQAAEASRWEDLWRRVHALRRQIVLANPLAQTGPIAFVKQAPSVFSHQLTQYYGASARPGGGVFVLEAPGKSMQCRQLGGSLPLGSCQHLDVSFDGDRILFAHCQAETTPQNRTQFPDRFYHLYEIAADGSGLRQLTEGAFDDFSPRYLPSGKIMFISTRRGGFHRCGGGPCPVYTLTLCDADGGNLHVVSYHETHEWDPAVLNDGRVIYTRWDYVDRSAVHYQQLWSVRPDGSDVRIFYGNNTFNPVGVWEARPVPGSQRVMATAAAHHAMTAGSIILLDVTRGIDGLEPIARLTPDALFSESEVPVARKPGGAWHAPIGVPKPPVVPPEAARWPGHNYRSPYPLSETYFLAAYSYDSLIGEPTWNPANMFGLYLVDAFGNKELLYRDLNIASLWPMPLRPRERPPALPSQLGPTEKKEGTFFLQNVYKSWPPLPRDVQIKRLRIVQVLPKTTPHINNPTVGLANASPGKQVLGTVPVETDGSAYFCAPAGIALAFQALDEHGEAVQTMRSVTYLQPGESASCVGCHEPRISTAASGPAVVALKRAPSAIAPAPNGSKPLSYPILVQPVLDRRCVSCHNHEKPEGKVVLTGEPQGRYTASYNALAPRVPFAAWQGGDFLRANSEPATQPNHFGARGSKLMQMLLAGHENVVLTAEEIDRLTTWMDANALFYGTFDPVDQAKQQRGERIEGPKLE